MAYPNTEHLNRVLFLYINALAGKSQILDRISVATAEFMPYVFIIWLAGLWCKNRDANRKYVRLALGASLLGLSINALIPLVLFSTRPFVMGMGTPLIQHIPDASFPSDHTTFLLSIAWVFLFAQQQTRQTGFLMMGSALLCGLARIFCGLHFPVDILGAGIVSAFSAGLVLYAEKHVQKIRKIIF